MSVTKQHFEAIARIIRKEAFSQACDGFQYIGLENLTDELAEYFEKQNPQFDRIRFLKACGAKV